MASPTVSSNVLPAIFVQSNALLATLARTKVLPDILMWSNVLPATFVQTKRVACPLGETMIATTFL